jgi:Cd2+/Zn2+-exporting ATPase
MAELPTTTERAYRVEGMDCGSCATTITSALSGLPGVSNANVSVAREMLTLDLDTARTSSAEVEKTVNGLGFGTSVLNDDTPEPVAPSSGWNTPKTRHLLICIGVSVAALLGGLLAPALEPVLLTLAVVYALWPIAKRAWVAARLGAVFTIQMLMSIAALGAIIIGEQHEALLVVLLFMVGEFLEGLAAERARSGIKALGALLPDQAWLLEADTPKPVNAAELQIDQTVLVRPGDRMPADGQIVDGTSSIDESPVTGESVPVSKGPGDEVLAGTVNHDAALQVRVTRAAEDNTIARIITLVEEAQDAKAPTERFIERFSRIYMPIVIAIAVIVAIVPPLIGMGSWDTWTYRALALLLIGCPCALVISVPAAIAASLSAGARRGILVKGGAVMEQLASTTAIVFDKTGTLTQGKPAVTDIVAGGRSEAELLALAAAVERGSSHPLAEAICRKADTRKSQSIHAADIRVDPGKGMIGSVDGAEIFIGAPRFAAERADLSASMQKQIAQLEAAGKTVVIVTESAAVAGLIALRDEPRTSTRAGLAQLKEQGISTVMMTGDNPRTAAAIGEDLGIAVQAEMLPQYKAQQVRQLAQAETVMMVGDGINDAPALAESHVGVAIGSGTDVAMEAANAAIMRNDIGDVARMTQLARSTMSVVRQNVFIALGLKAIFLVTTITGLSGLWMAVLADTGATVMVTLNSMRLLGFFGRDTESKPQPDASLPGSPDAMRP